MWTSAQPDEADIAALQSLWLHEEGVVDLAIALGPDLLDWISPNLQIAANARTQGASIVGYTRVHASEPTQPRMLLARDYTTAREIGR